MIKKIKIRAKKYIPTALPSTMFITLVVDRGCDAFPPHYSVSVDCARPSVPSHNGPYAHGSQNVDSTVLTMTSAPLDVISQNDTVTLAASDGHNVAAVHGLFCCHPPMMKLNGI